MPDISQNSKQKIINCWYAGVDAVRGELVTRNALAADGITEIRHLLAVGKAASSMCLGAATLLSPTGKALLVTKRGHVDAEIPADPRFECIEAGHPIPDENSCRAGERAREFVYGVGESDDLVILVSGGASALVEYPVAGIGLEELKRINEILISEGYNIDQINAVRNLFSRIKGGKLLQEFKGNRVHVYAISDVPGDDIHTIGSGIGGPGRATTIGIELPGEIQKLRARLQDSDADEHYFPRERYHARIVASNNTARIATAECARQMGVDVVLNTQALDQDFEQAAEMIAFQLQNGQQGIYIWGGEPTVNLPRKPGRGGRNQSLGLAIARNISGCENIAVIAAGTDGTDGPTDAAGAIVDGDTFATSTGGQLAIDNADAGTFLEKAGALFRSGPTGTNVMDLVVAYKSE